MAKTSTIGTDVFVFTRKQEVDDKCDHNDCPSLSSDETTVIFEKTNGTGAISKEPLVLDNSGTSTKEPQGKFNPHESRDDTNNLKGYLSQSLEEVETQKHQLGKFRQMSVGILNFTKYPASETTALSKNPPGCKQDKKLSELQKKVKLLTKSSATLEILQEKNKHVIKELRSTIAKSNEKKAEMELELINQLSSLAESKKATEEKYEHRLKEKIDSVVKLRVQVLEKEEEISELKKKLDQVEETDLTENERQTEEKWFFHLEEENKVLEEKTLTLTTENRSLKETLVELGNRVASLSQVEIEVVPELNAQLEASRSALIVIENDIVAMNEDKKLAEKDLRRSLASANSNQSKIEADLLNQLINLENEKNNIAQEQEKRSGEKDRTISSLELKVMALQEKVLQLQSHSELDSISSHGEVERLMQTNMSLSSDNVHQKEMVHRLRKTLKKSEATNKKLVADLKRLEKTLAYSSKSSSGLSLESTNSGSSVPSISCHSTVTSVTCTDSLLGSDEDPDWC